MMVEPTQTRANSVQKNRHKMLVMLTQGAKIEMSEKEPEVRQATQTRNPLKERVGQGLKRRRRQ